MDRISINKESFLKNWMMAGLAIILMIVFWPHQAFKNSLAPSGLQNNTGQSAANTGLPNGIASSIEGHLKTASSVISGPSNTKAIDQSEPTANSISPVISINPINPIRSDAQVLQAIAQLNENRERINTLLTSKATLAAEVRQQVEADKYQSIKSQTIPGPNTDPAPSGLIAKLKSNQLMHH